MDRMNYPRGLIRYDTQNGMSNHWTRSQLWRRVFRPRVMVYSAILVVIVGALATSLAMRSPFRVDVVRDRASLARQVEDGWIENVYQLQIMNAAERTQRYRIEVLGLTGAMIGGEPAVQELGPAEARWVPMAVRLPPEAAQQLGAGAHTVRFQITRLPEMPTDKPLLALEESTFIVPR